MTTPLTKKERVVGDQVLALLLHLPPESAVRVLAHVENFLDAEEGNDGPRFSRGIAGPLGKLEHPLKTKVDEHTHTLFLQQCSMQSTDASNQLRNCVYALVHGRSYDQMVLEKLSHEAQRTQALAKLIGPFGGPEFDGANGGGARTE